MQDDDNNSEIHEPTYALDEFVKQNITNPTANLSNTDLYSAKYLGLCHDFVRSNIIVYGQTNFDQPETGVTADQKVLLYCYLNMRQHLLALKKLLLNSYQEKTIAPYIKTFLGSDRSKPAVFIDCGCGPLTGGLALDEFLRSIHRNIEPLSYIGIDCSNTMLKIAHKFCNQSPMDITGWTFEFHDCWDTAAVIRQIGRSAANVIVNFSYLFANITTDQAEIAACFVKDIVKSCEVNSLIILCQNSPRRLGTFEHFKETLDNGFELIVNEKRMLRYKTRRRDDSPDKKVEVCYDIYSK